MSVHSEKVHSEEDTKHELWLPNNPQRSLIRHLYIGVPRGRVLVRTTVIFCVSVKTKSDRLRQKKEQL